MEEIKTRQKKREVPIHERLLLSVNDASDYTGIGINTIRRIANNNNLILWVGSRKMIKRKKLEEYIDRTYSI